NLENDAENTFHAQLALLNAINDEYNQWQWTRARKIHKDQFGDLIEEGEEYLKRSTGPAYDQVLKMSQRSAERLLDVLFTYNHVGKSLCEHVKANRDRRHDAEMGRMVKALERLHDAK